MTHCNEQESVNHDEYPVVLVLPWAHMVLLERHGQVLRLPHIAIPKWARRAEQLTKAITERWGVRSIVIDFLPNRTKGLSLVLVEVRTHDWNFSVDGLVPVQVDEINENELAGAERIAVRNILAGGAQERGPFSRLGWVEEAKEWIQASVPECIIEFSEDIRSFNASGPFALVRFGTVHGPAYWLKATSAPNVHEFTVTRALARYLPEYLPPIVVTREDWNAWIMEDSGDPLCDTASHRSFEQAAHCLAGLQKASTPHLEALLNSGCIDQRMPILRGHLPGLMRYLEDVMAKQTSISVPPIKPGRLYELGDLLDKACAIMQMTNIPDTLIHNDVNDGNILFDGKRAVFTDWAEAYIGNPFFTFHHLRAQALRGDHTHVWADQLTETYKQHWCDYLAEAEVVRALALTPPLAIVSYLCGRDPSFASEYRHDARCESYARSLGRHIDRAVQAPEFKGALCN